MFGLSRLLALAGTISWRLNTKHVRSRNGTQSIQRSRLSIESLEDRVVPTLLGQQLFPGDYPWNQNISNAPVAANSANVIANIGNSIGLHPDWGESSASNGNDPLYGIPFNVVHGNAPGVTRVNVVIDNYPDESELIAVPMPSSVVIEGDYQNGPNPFGPGYDNTQRGDSHLIIWDEDNNIAYELFGAARPTDPITMAGGPTNGVWHAAQESVWNMNTNSFRTLGDTSADAAGLSILAGLARPDEGLPVAQGGQGEIDHALRFTLPSSKILPQYIYPASHVVSTSGGANKLPFGARLRLMNTPAVNAVISTLGPEAQIVAHAMQQYGLVLADIGSSMYITGASASVNANNVSNFTWDMDDVLGLSALKASYFQVVDLTPQITGLSLSSAAAGSTITVTGQNFSGAAGHLSVVFGNTAATSVTYVDDAHLTVVVPNGTGTVNVKVQSGVQATDPNNPNNNVTNPVFGYGTSGALSFQYTNSTQTVSGANSTASFGAGTIASGNSTTLTIVVRDTTNAVVAGLPSNAFSLSVSGGTSAGTFGSVSTTGTPGTYTVSFAGSTAGTASSLSAIVNGVTLTAQPTIIVTVGNVSSTKSSVSLATATVASGGTDLVTIVVKDAGNNAIAGLASSAFSFSLTGGTSTGAFGSVSATSTQGTYTVSFTGTTLGTASSLNAVVNGVTLSAHPSVTVAAGAVSASNSTVSAANSTVASGGTDLVTLVVKDAAGNAITGLANNAFSFSLSGGTSAGTFGSVSTTGTPGTYTVSFTGTTSGTASSLNAIVSGVTLTTHPAITVTVGAVNAATSSVSFAASSVTVGGTVLVTLLVKDVSGNAITGLSSNAFSLSLSGGTSAGAFSAVAPTGTPGVYTATFTATTAGTATALTATINGVNLNTKPTITVNPPSAVLPFADALSGPGSQLSAFWTTQTGSFSIANGVAAGQTAVNLATLNGINQANTSVQAVVNVPVGQYAGMVSRYQGTGLQSMYFAGLLSSGSGYAAGIWICQNGAFTLLTALTSVSGNGQGTLLLKTLGNSLQLYWQPNGANGYSQVATLANATLTTGSVGVLGSMGTSVSNFSAASASVVPPQNATLSFTENFGAANYPANLGSQLSSFWTNQTGDLSIINGSATGQTAVNLATLNGINQANTAVQAVVNVPVGQYAGVVSRYQGTGLQSMYFAGLLSSGSGFAAGIWIGQNGAFTLLTALTPVSGNGQGTLLLKTVGTSLQLYWQPNGANGYSQVATLANATLTTGSVGVLGSLNIAISSFSAAVASAIAPQNATLSFTENFGAANYPGNLGSQLSSFWTNQTGDLSIVNGNATGQTAVNLATLNGINQADTAIQAVVNVPAGQYAGVVSRYQGTGLQSMYFAGLLSSASGYAAGIWIGQNGAFTLLTALTPVSGNGQGTLLLKTVGASLQLYWQPSGANGFSQVATLANATLTTGSVGVLGSMGASFSNFNAGVATVVPPQNATLPFTENFSAPNYPGNLGSQLSSYWQNQIGDISIINGNATGQNVLNLAALNGVNVANVSVQADVNVPAGQSIGLISRYGGSGERDMYFGGIIATNIGFAAGIWINQAGVWTQLTVLVPLASAQGTLRFTTIGSSLQLFWNGILIAGANDARLATGTIGVRSSAGAAMANFSAS